MFWNCFKRGTKSNFNKESHFPYEKRMCWIYVSDRYEQMLFVPMGKIDPWRYQELENVIVKDWPMEFGELQSCIEVALDSFGQIVEDGNSKDRAWPSFDKSKAKSQRSFKADYIKIKLETDLSKGYGEGERERILIRASPKDWLEDNYELVAVEHLMETFVAQAVLDITKACFKIRS